MDYTREDLFVDMAENIIRVVKESGDDAKENLIDRLRRLCRLIDNEEI